MKKVYLSHMAWPEVQDIVNKRPTVLIPVGSNEAQNLHNPTGYDAFVAQRLVEEAAKKCNAVIAPVQPYGYSDIFVEFPGTITLRPETLEAVFVDIAKSLIKSGFDHMLFVNNHDPNHVPLSNAINKVRDECGITCASIWPTTLARSFAQDLFDNANEVLVHGNEPSTSLMKYLYPDLIRMDLAKSQPKPSKFQNFELASPSNLSHQGQKVPIFLRVHDVAPQGGWGDPKGDVEAGKVMFERMVDFVASFVEKYNDLDTKVEQSR